MPAGRESGFNGLFNNQNQGFPRGSSIRNAPYRKPAIGGELMGDDDEEGGFGAVKPQESDQTPFRSSFFVNMSNITNQNRGSNYRG